MVERYPTTPLLAYLISLGFCWESQNEEGETAADILLQQGCPKDVIDSLNSLYVRTSGKITNCMGKENRALPAVLNKNKQAKVNRKAENDLKITVPLVIQFKFIDTRSSCS